MTMLLTFISLCVFGLIRKNLLDLRIFFEELSYSRVVQKAAYPKERLISKCWNL